MSELVLAEYDRAKCDEMNTCEVDRGSVALAEETEFLKRQERDLCRSPDNRAGRRAAASKRRNKRK